MTSSKKAARSSCNYNAPLSSLAKKDKPILTEYERGTRWAGWLFVGMFIVLSFGAVVFGW